MPEDADIPVHELQDRIRETLDEAEAGAARGRMSHSRFIKSLAASTAIFAVLAAIAALASGSYANEALFKANQAALSQNRATDTWAEYQADGLKRIAYANTAATLKQQGAPDQQVQDVLNNSKREGDKQPPLRGRAERLQNEAAALERESSEQLAHHHRFSFSVTFFQVAIGLAALGALINIQPLWWMSMVSGLAGMIFFVAGFLPVHESLSSPAGGEPTPVARRLDSRPRSAPPLTEASSSDRAQPPMWDISTFFSGTVFSARISE